MVFILKHCDKTILKFSANEASSNPDYKILWVTDEKSLLPLGFDLSEEGLSNWVKHRTIPKNRAYMDNLLSKSGLSPNRPLSVVYYSKGLSLNDVYWVVPEDFEGKFADNNLYDNRFNRILSQIVFTGYGSSVKSSLLSSPEFTTNGMLPKCWRRINGKIELYKGSTSGFSNNGFEAYSEYYAYPVGRLVTKGGFEAVCEYYKNLEPCVYDGFIDTAKKVLIQEHKKNLKKLLNFKFKKHPKYNLGAIRLRKIEDQVQRNVMELLG